MLDTNAPLSGGFRAQATRVLPRPVKRGVRRLVSSRVVPAGARVPRRSDAASYVPTDHARQVHSHYYIEEAMTARNAPALVVDLGCGNGSSREQFRHWRPDVRWVGVDIQQSDLARAITGEEVILYDGIHLPFPKDSVPLIYTNQVFEHVRHPEPLLRDIRRVLTPGGIFIGSTSQLEPYHSYSLWGGYTLYGWRQLCADAGLELEEARPSIDAIALITRQFEGAQPHHNTWWQQSPLNATIDAWAQDLELDAAATNARKLQFCGQFAFRVRKPLDGPGALSSAAMVRARRHVGTALMAAGRRLARVEV